MIRRFAILSLLLTAALCVAQNAIPDTPSGRLLHGWLESFNAGDVARHAKSLAEHDSQADRGAPPRAGRAAADPVSGDGRRWLRLQPSRAAVRHRDQGHSEERGGFGWAEGVFKVDAAKPDVIASSEFHQTPTPKEALPARGARDVLVKDVDQLAQKLTAEDRFSGVVLMAKGGKPFFQKAYGEADRDQKTANDVDTKFRLGSMNKMFTSVAIAQLVQQGKLKYTDTLAKVLPDYPKPEATAKITVHQLLTHTSGLGDFFGPEFDKKKDNIRDLKDYLQFFAAKPLRFEPGTSWSYRNAGMIVAGLVVERVSGQNHFDYVREHIYKPAGMKDSDSYEKTKPQPDQSVGYTMRAGKWVSNYDTLPRMGSSAGGGDSTAPDLLRFDPALRVHKLLNAELTNLIITSKTDTGHGGDKYAYGLVETAVDGKRVVGHGGGAPGMNANLDMYWDSGYTAVVLANRDPHIVEQVNGYIRKRIQR